MQDFIKIDCEKRAKLIKDWGLEDKVVYTHGERATVLENLQKKISEYTGKSLGALIHYLDAEKTLSCEPRTTKKINNAIRFCKQLRTEMNHSKNADYGEKNLQKAIQPCLSEDNTVYIKNGVWSLDSMKSEVDGIFISTRCIVLLESKYSWSKTELDDDKLTEDMHAKWAVIKGVLLKDNRVTIKKNIKKILSRVNYAIYDANKTISTSAGLTPIVHDRCSMSQYIKKIDSGINLSDADVSLIFQILSEAETASPIMWSNKNYDFNRGLSDLIDSLLLIESKNENQTLIEDTMVEEKIIESIPKEEPKRMHEEESAFSSKLEPKEPTITPSKKPFNLGKVWVAAAVVVSVAAGVASAYTRTPISDKGILSSLKL